MRIKVKLFGTLARGIPGYDLLNGMDVNIPDEARVSDLLAHLGIPDRSDYVVIMDKHIVKSTDKIVNGGTIQIFQALAGG